MAMTQDEMKQAVARAALEYVVPDSIIGIGTGSTANFFIDYLAEIKGRIEGTVASSEASAARLKSHGIPVYDLNPVELEQKLNNITGVVTNGLFAMRPADVVLVGSESGVSTL